MEMSHMHLVKVFLKFNSWWFLLRFGWFSKFKHESVFSLVFPKEVRWFHKCYNFCDKQMENDVIHLLIHVLIIGLEFMMTKKPPEDHD